MPCIYDKQQCRRDRLAAQQIQVSLYADYTDAHLRNALRFALGCAGAEAEARVKAIRSEIRRRKL